MLVSRDAIGGVEDVFVEAEAHLVAADATECCEAVVVVLRVVTREVVYGGAFGRGFYCCRLYPAIYLASKMHASSVVKVVRGRLQFWYGGYYLSAQTSIAHHRQKKWR